MPKEVITFGPSEERGVYDADGVKTGSVMCCDPRLALHWSTLNSTELDLHGGVSLSVMAFPSVPLAEYQEMKSWPPTASDEVYISLDRAEINKLIRLLRRARDAAYGGDE